jgi:hypothetical protein
MGAGTIGQKAKNEVFKKVTGPATKAIAAASGVASGTGPVGYAVSYAFSRIITWITPKLVRGGKYIVYLTVGGALGFAALGTFAGAAGGGILGAGIAGIPSGATSAFLGKTGLFINTILVSTIKTLSKITAVAALLFIIFTAFVVYVITTGAYVVPQGKTASGTVGNNSPFIDVTKTVDPNPSDGFENGDSRLKSVKFTVTIKATTSTLTLGDKPINDVCKIIQEQNNNVPCPEKKDVTTNCSKTLNPGQTCTFSYTMDLSDPNLKDAFVTNTASVVADASGEQGAESSAGTSVKIGNPPEECPSGWPISGVYPITQGPHGPQSHSRVFAIDIGVPRGTRVTATHSGTVSLTALGPIYGPAYGRYVVIISSCNGHKFQSIYGHFGVIEVKNGQTVTKGEEIGRSNNTGNSTGDHLHYEFNAQPLPMTPPYIPRTVPERCGNSATCGRTTGN